MRKRIVYLCIAIFVLAAILVVGSAWLIKKAKDIPPEEEQITWEEITHLLSEAKQENRILFLEQCTKEFEEKGYWLREQTTENLIAFMEEKEPELGLAFRQLNVIAVNGDAILAQSEDGLYDYQVKEMAGLQTQIEPGDSLRVIGTQHVILQVAETEKTQVLLEAAWIRANTEQNLTVIYDGKEFVSANLDNSYNGYEDIADIVIEDGGCASVQPYTEKINGKLLSVKERTIELEEFGTYEYDEGIQVYKLFGEYEPYTVADLQIGYDFTDFVLDKRGKIVAALATRDGYLDKIRVVIKTSEFASAYHEEVILKCDTDMAWKSGDREGVIAGGEEVAIGNNSELFGNDRITFVPAALSAKTTLLSVERNQGTPWYRGTMEVERTQEGLLVINELPLDEYLYSVVPSEMPASYPLEALKAQAVSARTYAYAHMQSSRLQSYGAHVDDSAAFQVYNNIMENETTTKAVRETEGVIVSKDGKPVTTYFYSTSCGYGTDISAWLAEGEAYLKARQIGVCADGENEEENVTAMTAEEEFRRFICDTDSDSYEKEDSYYRWKYETAVDEELLLSNLQKRYGANPEQILTETSDGFVPKEIKEFGQLNNIEIVKRAPGGAVTEMILEGSDATVKILSEKNVRYILANVSTELMLGASYEKDGTANGMLPSAFLVIDTVHEASEEEEQQEETEKITSYTVYGGGFGHGIGMSQNGAKQMAKRGMDFEAILQFYYVETELVEMKEE